jgi:hypothetical protein
VSHDGSGQVELVLDAEAPTRLVKQLGQLWRACGMLGLDHAASWEVVRRAALDSVPKLRGAVVRVLARQAGALPREEGEPFLARASVTEIADAVSHPQRTTRRTLDALEAHKVVKRIRAGGTGPETWELGEDAITWLAAARSVPEMATPSLQGGTKEGTTR